MTYTQLLDDEDYYWSVTLTSLIVATYGGGTGLATQRECLELLGCYGRGKVKKFAEICAAVVLAGETSLSSAILRGDWVSSHEALGRNRDHTSLLQNVATARVSAATMKTAIAATSPARSPMRARYRRAAGW